MPGKNKSSFEQVDIISFIVLIMAAGFFFYFALCRNAEWNIKHFSLLAKKTEAKISKLKKEIKDNDVNNIKKEEEDEPISDVPKFLEMLSKKFEISGLELDNIKKADNDYTYEFVTYASFDKLVDFLYRTEQSNLAIQDLDIHPYSSDKQLININLRLIRNKLSPEETDAFKIYQKRFAQIRDPFKKGKIIVGTLADQDKVKPPINLTYKYKLTGIGFDRERYATIEHNNYYKGDNLNGMTVVKILSDRVNLESGSSKYFISFRYKKKGTKK